MWYHCVQYTRRHLMSLISHSSLHLPQSWLIWACYLFLQCSALQAVQTTSRMNNMLKEAKPYRNHASNMRLGSYDGAWYTEYNGTTFVIVSQILIEWGQFFVHRDNIWQTLSYGTNAGIDNNNIYKYGSNILFDRQVQFHEMSRENDIFGVSYCVEHIVCMLMME